MKLDFWFTASLQLERYIYYYYNISKFLGTAFVGRLLPWQRSVTLSQLRLELFRTQYATFNNTLPPPIISLACLHVCL